MNARKKTPKFWLKRNEALGRGIRRLVREQIDDALAQLRQSDDRRRGVHDARKSVKKIRAILRLVAREFGRDQFRKENQSFRDAAQCLSPLRDAEAQLNVIDHLTKRFRLDQKSFEVTRRHFAKEATQLYRNAQAPIRRSSAALRRARRRVSRWPLGDFDWPDVCKQIRRTYKKGVRALHKVQEAPSSENLHAWRKRVKELWYHLRLSKDLVPDLVSGLSDEANNLANLVGEGRDLAILRERLLADGDAQESVPLIAKIDLRRAELQKAAIELGAHFYAEKPRAFAKRLRHSLDEPRKNKVLSTPPPSAMR